MRVALFIACFNDLLFPEVGRAVVSLLERLGQTVVFPEAQTCCGQLHLNTEYRDEALSLARRFARVFDAYDVVVTPSPSCAAMVRLHYPVLAADAADAALQRTMTDLAPRVREVTEFLVDDLGIVDLGARFPHTVASTRHVTRFASCTSASGRSGSSLQSTG